jgi:hypothetical protein
MNTQPYIGISERIRAKCPQIKHIDLYNGQYANAEKEDPFNTPAVFIEYMGGATEAMTRGMQILNAGFVLHVVGDTYDRTANIDLKTPPEQAAKLAHLTLDSLVHKAVNDWQPAGCVSVMARTGIDYDTNHDQIFVTRLTYACAIADETFTETETTVTDVAVEGKIVEFEF